VTVVPLKLVALLVTMVALEMDRVLVAVVALKVVTLVEAASSQAYSA
jgi:hypothetical protein